MRVMVSADSRNVQGVGSLATDLPANPEIQR